MKYLLVALIIIIGVTAILIIYQPRAVASLLPSTNFIVSSNRGKDEEREQTARVPRRLNLTKLEIADSFEERQQGLQYRTDLCQTCGMLFVFENPQFLSFWMLNTKIPLDMLFIDENGKIVTMYQNTTPLNTDLRYKSTSQALYVLELPGGYTINNKVSVGETLDIQHLIDNGIPFVWVDEEGK